MSEALGNRPEEQYREHRAISENFDKIQQRLDAARLLQDILTPEQIGQITNETWASQDETGQQYEQNIESSKEHFESNSGDYIDQAKKEMEERDQKLREDQYVERLKHHILGILDRYKDHRVLRFSGDGYVSIDNITPNQILTALPDADKLTQVKTNYQLRIIAHYLTPEQRDYLMRKVSKIKTPTKNSGGFDLWLVLASLGL
jgi:hypothetical protein